MHVRQAANVLDLLEYFAKRKRPATLAEISDDLAWPRSSTFNLVGTLADKGFLYEPFGRRGYYPSPRWLGLSQAVAEAEPLPEAVHAAAAEVADKTGETTVIGAPAGAFVSFIQVIESMHSVRYFAHIGDRVPIHASSLGRALLAQAPLEERQALYRKIDFQRYSSTTPMRAETVEEELLTAKQRGYQQSDSEYLPDLAGVAMPLNLPERRLAIAVAGPVSRCLQARAAFAQAIGKALIRQGLS